MRGLQTPPRDQASAIRRTKFTSNLNSNLRKAMSKSLDPALKAVLEDDSTVLEFLKEFPEVSAENPFSADVNLAAAYPVDAHYSSKPAAISDLTSSSMFSEITSEKHVSTSAGDTKHGDPEINSDHKFECYEAEVVIKHLREARIQVMKSKDLGPSKKLLKAVIENVIEEFYGGRYEDTKWLHELASNKGNLVSLIVMMGIFAVLVIWFFSSGTKGFIAGPPPT